MAPRVARSRVGIGADFYIIFHNNDASLRYFVVAALFESESEPIGADHRSAVDDDPGADPAALAHRDIGVENGVIANLHIIGEYNAGMKLHTLPEPAPAANGHQRPD